MHPDAVDIIDDIECASVEIKVSDQGRLVGERSGVDVLACCFQHRLDHLVSGKDVGKGYGCGRVTPPAPCHLSPPADKRWHLVIPALFPKGLCSGKENVLVPEWALCWA